MNIQISDIWTAAGILIGFQVASFSWRVSREVSVAQKEDLTWLPPADIVNLASMIVTVIGVFVLPTLGLVDLTFTLRSFGLAVLIFAGYPFALAGHYDMYNNKTTRSYLYFPLQERVVVVAVTILAIGYIVLAFR
jgi:hypothetical protein